MLKFRIMHKLRKTTLSWDILVKKFPKVGYAKLYNALASLSADGYITIYDDAAFGVCYRISNVNSYRDYIREMFRPIFSFLYSLIIMLGSIAAILTLVKTLL